MADRTTDAVAVALGNLLRRLDKMGGTVMEGHSRKCSVWEGEPCDCAIGKRITEARKALDEYKPLPPLQCPSCDSERRADRGDACDDAWHDQQPHEPRALPRWIPVTERMPPSNTEVAIIDRHQNVGTAWTSVWSDGRFGGWTFPHRDMHTEPTHWCPLPGFPETKAEHHE